MTLAGDACVGAMLALLVDEHTDKLAQDALDALGTLLA